MAQEEGFLGARGIRYNVLLGKSMKLPVIPWNHKDSSMTLLVMLGLLSVFAPFLRGCAHPMVDSPSQAGSVWPLAFHRLCARQACSRVHWSGEHGDVKKVGFR